MAFPGTQSTQQEFRRIMKKKKKGKKLPVGPKLIQIVENRTIWYVQAWAWKDVEC